MAKKKKIAKVLKLQVPAGGASPQPSVGPALGQAGINIMDFCNALIVQPKIKRKVCHYLLLSMFLRINLLILASNLHQHQYLLGKH